MFKFLGKKKILEPNIDLDSILASNPYLLQVPSLKTEHYVTLFDACFLPQGLCLYYSLLKNAGDFVLWVLCIDQDCFDLLQRLNLPRLRLLHLGSLETPELLAVKPNRSRAEYCWTLTPFASRFVFEADQSVERVTYLDADMYFFKNPRPIFKEFEQSGKQVLITEHAYAPENDQSSTSGQYCVQLLVFNRASLNTVSKWWQDQCIDWCKSYFEDGRFGDQKYLESFERLFPDDVHVLTNLDILLAPWNASRFPYSRCVAFHFHQLRLTGPITPVKFVTGYRIPKPTLKNIYFPYIALLKSLLIYYELPVPKQSKHQSFAYFIFRKTLTLLNGNGSPGMFQRHIFELDF